MKKKEQAVWRGWTRQDCNQTRPHLWLGGSGTDQESGSRAGDGKDEHVKDLLRNKNVEVIEIYILSNDQQSVSLNTNTTRKTATYNFFHNTNIYLSKMNPKINKKYGGGTNHPFTAAMSF